MYFPVFLPCFKCCTGPDIWRDEYGHVQAKCDCGIIEVVTHGVTVPDHTDFTTDEIKRIAIAWSDAVIGEFYDKPLR